MEMRAYTVRELDALRQVVESKWLYGSYCGPRSGSGWSRNYTPAEKITAVEEMVRTHMLAGHTAADLLESERPTSQVSSVTFASQESGRHESPPPA